jgi:hypothetical protein
VAAAGAGLAAALVPLVAWEPLYDKLWLRPLAWLSLLAALAAPLAAAPRGRAIARVLGLALAVLAAINLGRAAAAHRRPTPYLAEAARVAALTAGRDLVVHDWDRISVLYGTLWGWDPRRHRFDFPTAVTQRRSAARPDLDRAVAATRRRGGRVFFLGVVDQPRAQWDAFLGRRAGVAYDVLAPYRRGLREVARFRYGATTVRLLLWQEDSSAGPAASPAPWGG